MSAADKIVDAETLLGMLHPFRGPAPEAVGVAAEALAALAVGLALGAALVALRGRRRAADPLAAARAGPPEARLTAALAALRAAARPRPGEDWAAAADRRTRGGFSRAPTLAAARDALYRGGPLPDPDRALAEARRLLRRLRRARP
jgi:hypothetical protein